MNQDNSNGLGLPGLEADNLLAFLALLGTLRALETAQPEWQPRMAWHGPPWRPSFHASHSLREDEATTAVLEGLRRLAPAYDFEDQADITWSVKEFRVYAREILDADHPEAVRLLAALASDGSVRQSGAGRDGTVAATALCAMFGQGHQHFLGQLARLPELASAPRAREDIAGALFKPWSYEQRSDALRFRWDPAEDRRYAYRFGNPSGEAVGVVAGANLLAAVGFPTFVVAPQRQELITLGFRRDRRERHITWPIWGVPLSLVAIRALLSHPELVSEAPDRRKLTPYGVVELMRANRIQQDKYFNFSRARPLWGATDTGTNAGQHGRS